MLVDAASVNVITTKGIARATRHDRRIRSCVAAERADRDEHSADGRCWMSRRRRARRQTSSTLAPCSIAACMCHSSKVWHPPRASGRFASGDDRAACIIPGL
jgi:hypothetical protein